MTLELAIPQRYTKSKKSREREAQNEVEYLQARTYKASEIL